MTENAVSGRQAIADDFCRVCGGNRLGRFVRVEGRDYFCCRSCEATFLSLDQLPSPEEERKQYSQHRNEINDAGYRRFLSKLVVPLAARLPPGSIGLDYGCGPGPAGAAMLRERGHQITEYDPIFAPDMAALTSRYDFIFCSEAVEHFHHPRAEFNRLNALLKPGGWLGIMTCFQTDDAAFPNWHYRRDPTHVAFYRERTFEVVAEQFGWSCHIPCKDVALLRRG